MGEVTQRQKKSVVVSGIQLNEDSEKKGEKLGFNVQRSECASSSGNGQDCGPRTLPCVLLKSLLHSSQSHVLHLNNIPASYESPTLRLPLESPQRPLTRHRPPRSLLVARCSIWKRKFALPENETTTQSEHRPSISQTGQPAGLYTCPFRSHLAILGQLAGYSLDFFLAIGSAVSSRLVR